jgi:hypothetical protein
MSNWTEKQLPGGAVVNVYSKAKTLEFFMRAEKLQNVRYEAEWIAAQHIDKDTGEWDPDRDEYVGSTHATLEAAQRAAIEGSKNAGVVEWCRVAEETFDPSLNIPRRSSAAWDTTRVWHGDWEGNWSEDRS